MTKPPIPGRTVRFVRHEDATAGPVDTACAQLWARRFCLEGWHGEFRRVLATCTEVRSPRRISAPQGHLALRKGDVGGRFPGLRSTAGVRPSQGPLDPSGHETGRRLPPTVARSAAELVPVGYTAPRSLLTPVRGAPPNPLLAGSGSAFIDVPQWLRNPHVRGISVARKRSAP